MKSGFRAFGVQSATSCGDVAMGSDAFCLLGHGLERDGSEQCLRGGGGAAQGVEFHGAGREVDLDPDETMLPVGIGSVKSSHDHEAPGFVGAAQEDDEALDGRLWSEGEVLRKGTAQRPCRVDGGMVLGLAGRHILAAAGAQAGEVAVDEALPDHALPAAVVAFDSGLES